MNESSLVAIILEWIKYSGLAMSLYVVGAVIASTHLTRYPRPAWLALAGCGLCLLAGGAGLLQHVIIRGNMGIPDEAMMFIGIISWITRVVYLAGFGMVFAAVFVDRRCSEPPSEVEPT